MLITHCLAVFEDFVQSIGKDARTQRRRCTHEKGDEDGEIGSGRNKDTLVRGRKLTVVHHFKKGYVCHYAVKIVCKESTAAKYYNSPRFISSRQLSSDLIAVFLKKKKVVLDRKYSIGFSILEISKLIMYEYFYEVIVPRFGEENVDIILSDTDSFLLHIRNHTREEAREKCPM